MVPCKKISSCGEAFGSISDAGINKLNDCSRQHRFASFIRRPTEEAKNFAIGETRTARRSSSVKAPSFTKVSSWLSISASSNALSSRRFCMTPCMSMPKTTPPFFISSACRKSGGGKSLLTASKSSSDVSSLACAKNASSSCSIARRLISVTVILTGISV